MKKLLLFVFLNSVIFGNAQYTPSGNSLPDGIKDQNYSQVIGVDMPTLIEVGGAQVTSLIVSAFPPAQLYISSISGMTFPLLNLSAQLTVNGLPSGISYSCSPSSCSFPGGTSGSIFLNGVPTIGGNYNVSITSNTFGTLDLSALTALSGGLIPNSLAITDPLTGVFDKEYTLFIRDLNSISELDNSSISGISLYPNPANSHTTVKLYAQQNSNVKIDITDLKGRIVSTTQVEITNGWNELPLTLNLENGLYTISIVDSRYSVRKTLLITSVNE